MGTVPRRLPHEQLHAELGLELVDVTRDVRLHRVQPVGGGREGPLLGDGEQRFELAQIHAGTRLHLDRSYPSLVEIDRIATRPLTDGLVIGFT